MAATPDRHELRPCDTCKRGQRENRHIEVKIDGRIFLSLVVCQRCSSELLDASTRTARDLAPA